MEASAPTPWIGRIKRSVPWLLSLLLGLILLNGIGLLGSRSTSVRMAAIEQVLKRGGTLEEVEKITGGPSQIFESGKMVSPNDQAGVQFWSPATGQHVHRYGEEALPCYFDLWLLIDKSSRKILDSRLFRLDQYPKS